MPRVFLVHGWGGSSKNDWLPWAKTELTEKGYEVFALDMPDTEYPKIGPWVNKLKEVIGALRKDDVLIGHSIGCQTILRYLGTLAPGKKIKKVILIAPWWYLTLDESEQPEIVEPWLNSIVDFGKIKPKSGEFVCVFSNNDPWVPIDKNVEFFKKNLNPKIIIKEKMGHFTTDEGVTKLEFLPGLIE